MSAIFISYTGRDADGQGRVLAEQVAEWLREWGYSSLFRDKDLKEGIAAGSDWRQLLHARLAQCQLLIAVCSPGYEGSSWCMAEVVIAMDRGHKLVPLQLGDTALPLLLQNKQALTIQQPIVVMPELLEPVREQLKRALDELLDWRAKMPRLADRTSPYPGFLSFNEAQASVFFGRDDAIDALETRILALPGHRSEWLLLLGASGCGKSSLLRAGLIPRLRGAAGQGFLVVDPFRLDRQPLHSLASQLALAMERDGLTAQFSGEGTPEQLLDDCYRWRLHCRRQDAIVVLPIDQLEDLFSGGLAAGASAAERFLVFLADLLAVPQGRVLVVATMRTDFLAVLEARRDALQKEDAKRRLTWQVEPIQPMGPARYAEVIEGPARQMGLALEPGLMPELVADTGSGDALPLLAYTLADLWNSHKGRGFQPVVVEGVGQVHLLRRDLKTIGGVSGSVRTKADALLDGCTLEQRAALREAFVDHLVRISEEGDGLAAKQRAPLAELPPASWPLVQQFVEERLLVSDAGVVEIAHEALLRTWEPLKGWIEEGREELLQRQRVRRLTQDLKVEAPQRQRRQALEQLAALAAAGGLEQKAVAKEGREPLAVLLIPPRVEGKTPPTAPEADRADAALILALIGAEEPLSACLADATVPVELRRRAAESLGLLARRSGERAQRERIAAELEAVLRGEPLDVRVAAGWKKLETAAGWKQHDEHLPLLQGAAQGLQLAASVELRLLGSGPGLLVPMLTLTALAKGGELHITTEVVEVEVWRLPLPEGEQLELVAFPGGEHRIGSPADEPNRRAELGWYALHRDGCRDPQTRQPLDVEARRTVQLAPFWLVRHPISQGQWQAVVEGVAEVDWELEPSPGKANPDSLWERHGQPGQLAVDSVSWHDCREWLQRLNRWLGQEWAALGGQGVAPQLALPSEGNWEAACRAGAHTPFHFGDTLDARWARYDASVVFGLGRKGPKVKQPGVSGGVGLVNRYGLAEMHGQLYEWCADTWHPNPVGEGWPANGLVWVGEDGDLGRRESRQRDWKLLRGGSCRDDPGHCRAAFRLSYGPGNREPFTGLRPGCWLSPPRLPSWFLIP
jgi:formylglycine-generating enzyme required for sulfatase activity